MNHPIQNPPFPRPYIISWNLTYRCNLACEHCYLDAGPKKLVDDEAFSDRSELSTEQCFRVIDEIASWAPEAITILTGGEPLLRRDILDIVRYAAQKNLWAVCGTNGVKITENLAKLLKDAGLRGMALSLDALDPARHDAFRRVRGAWENTVTGAEILNHVELPFIVQTTVGKHNAAEVSAIADFAHDTMHAKVFNLYFLVQTGRGTFVSDISPAEYAGVLQELHGIQKKYQGKMLVNAKCAPHYMKFLYETEAESPFIKSYTGGAGSCPAGTQYMGIRPNGDVTPCPYLPLFGGNLKKDALREIWDASEVFVKIRQRDQLGGRCGSCEFGGVCGGCRARAYGVTNTLMNEDPLCDYEPGKHSQKEVNRAFASATQYGISNVPAEIKWDPEARTRMEKIPAFVRGMVVRRVEDYCRAQSLPRVTVAELDRLRAQMPANRLFSKPQV